MNALFWQRMHGGSTHFPIVLLLVSVAFDLVARWWRDDAARRGLRLAAFGCAIVGVLGGCGAVVSGLAMSHGQVIGTGYEKYHHLFVWPAFGLATGFVVWRSLKGGWIFQPASTRYLTGMGVAAALMMGAGYWGGEMLLGATPENISAADPKLVEAGHQLFLMNCAHCHGVDAHGDEGPDLHGVTRSDKSIAGLIANGKKGEMPKFGAKLSTNDVAALISYIRSLD